MRRDHSVATYPGVHFCAPEQVRISYQKCGEAVDATEDDKNDAAAAALAIVERSMRNNPFYAGALKRTLNHEVSAMANIHFADGALPCVLLHSRLRACDQENSSALLLLMLQYLLAWSSGARNHATDGKHRTESESLRHTEKDAVEGRARNCSPSKSRSRSPQKERRQSPQRERSISPKKERDARGAGGVAPRKGPPQQEQGVEIVVQQDKGVEIVVPVRTSSTGNKIAGPRERDASHEHAHAHAHAQTRPNSRKESRVYASSSAHTGQDRERPGQIQDGRRSANRAATRGSSSAANRYLSLQVRACIRVCECGRDALFNKKNKNGVV